MPTPSVWVPYEAFFGGSYPEQASLFQAHVNFDRFAASPRLKFALAFNLRDALSTVRLRVGGAWGALDGAIVAERGTWDAGYTGGVGIPSKVVATVANTWRGWQIVKISYWAAQFSGTGSLLAPSLCVQGVS
jgi:hypothetical protein